MIEYTYEPDRFSHAAAVCAFDDGILTAMYSGRAECHPTQKVYLYWTSKQTGLKGPAGLEPLTGNPILFEHNGVANIIYSKFEEFPTSRAHWWQHCTLWQRQILAVLPSGALNLSEPKQLIVEEDEDNPAPGRGYLPRCNPIQVDGTWYLPLYREQEPHFYGVIMKSDDGINWEHQGNIGKGTTRCIQPTIWHQDGKLHALLRNFNFGGRKQRYAYHSSIDLSEGSTWSEPTDSNIFNANNSLAVANTTKEGKAFPLLVWNHDPRGRTNISLGSVDKDRLLLLTKLEDYGSYPAVCVDKDDLHVLYTAKADLFRTPEKITVIKHKTYNVPALLEALQK